MLLGASGLIWAATLLLVVHVCSRTILEHSARSETGRKGTQNTPCVVWKPRAAQTEWPTGIDGRDHGPSAMSRVLHCSRRTRHVGAAMGI